MLAVVRGCKTVLGLFCWNCALKWRWIESGLESSSAAAFLLRRMETSHFLILKGRATSETSDQAA